MRLVIITAALFALVLGGCSDDDTGNNTGPDMAVKKDSGGIKKDTGGTKKDSGSMRDKMLKHDNKVIPPDGPVVKPDLPPVKPDTLAAPDKKLPQPDMGGKPPCKAWDAKGQGMCSMFLGYVWDGAACKGISGCSCAGVDCKHIYSSPTKCAAGQAHCGPTPSCKPMDVQGVGACKMLLGWYFNGKTCTSLGGCSCAGTDCGKLYKDSASCQAAYAACP